MSHLDSKQFEESILDETNKSKAPTDYRLSTITKERETNLEEIRKLTWFQRNFRRMEKGSLRGVVVMWIRMTLGVGVLTLPYYMSVYGYLTGVIAVVSAGLLNLNSFYNIFAASRHFRETSYLQLVEKSLGPVIYNVFKVSFFLDMSSSFIIIVIVCWNLFEYSLYFTGFTTKDWFLDQDKMKFDENNPVVARMRGIFILGLFVVSIPFFLKRTLHKIQRITIGILFLLLLLLVVIVAQAPFFYTANKDSPRIPFQPFDTYWIECFFSMLLSYYVQPFIFSLREELLVPSQKRLKKIANITVGFEIALFLVVGIAGYMSLGQTYMTDFFLTRKGYKGESRITEYFYQALIIIFFLFSSIGIAIFNPTMRDYLYQTIHLSENKKTYVLLSLLPFFVYCFVSYVKPNIIDVFNFTGLTICNFNGYIVPALMSIQVLRNEGGSRIKIGLQVIQVATLSILCVLGLYFKIK